ncbi:MAG: hypothetical protein FJY92_02405 [Candidatus Hydrogenedentes bacterium]|nr:hypothetical protein [Candidatus Hydrogenedentota bacterium]
MSDNFYPPPPLFRAKHYAVVAALLFAALGGGITFGYWLARERDAVSPDSAPPTTLAGVPATENSAIPQTTTVSTRFPKEPFTTSFDEGQLLAYRLDTEIEGGGTDTGDYSEVYMQFGSDVTLFTRKVAEDGTADLRFVFENAAVAGTFFDSPFEWSFDQAAQDAPASTPQTAFLSTPIEMRVAPDGTVLDITGPTSLKDMLGSIAAVPHLQFPNAELEDGLEWDSKLKLPVPGIGDAIDTTVHNMLVGRQRLGDYDCGVVVQTLGARGNDTQASAPGAPGEQPMLFSVPLFDLQGENTIYFDLHTGRLVHAAIDLEFALRIKEQLGSAGNFLQQIVPGMAGEHGAPDLERMLDLEGKPDLMDLSLTIKGAMSLVNEGAPLAMGK